MAKLKKKETTEKSIKTKVDKTVEEIKKEVTEQEIVSNNIEETTILDGVVSDELIDNPSIIEGDENIELPIELPLEVSEKESTEVISEKINDLLKKLEDKISTVSPQPQREIIVGTTGAYGYGIGKVTG